jgi:hypothetical protein
MPHLNKNQGKWYVNKKCNHAKNEVAYSKKNHHTITKKIEGGVKGEWGRK